MASRRRRVPTASTFAVYSLRSNETYMTSSCTTGWWWWLTGQGRNFVPKSGGYQFSEASRGWARGGVWGGLCPLPENFSLITLEKAHIGGYLMHSDVLILKLCIAVHRMQQGCATDSVSFSLTGCSSWVGTTVFRGKFSQIPRASLPNSAAHHGKIC